MESVRVSDSSLIRSQAVLVTCGLAQGWKPPEIGFETIDLVKKHRPFNSFLAFRAPHRHVLQRMVVVTAASVKSAVRSVYLTSQPMILSGRSVIAVLGPTNTGKTHYAIERMIAHGSGMIGLPLRLLAREVYTRLVERVGANNVSLITGEEKITPPKAKYSVCTVEALPRETKVAFVAIDEIQLAGDLERGHIFTDRLLNLRGREETLLLGSGTMTPI